MEELKSSHQLKTVVRQIINEHHPGVQELVEAGYDPQDSVEAVEQSMGDVLEAMTILDNKEKEEAEPGIFVRSASREETMQDQYVVDRIYIIIFNTVIYVLRSLVFINLFLEICPMTLKKTLLNIFALLVIVNT